MMTGLNTTRLTVAKLCHEMSGCLSIMKFLTEDLEKAQNATDLKDLFNEVEMMTAILEFFRAIYSDSKHKANIYDVIANLFQKKKVKLNNSKQIATIFDNLKTGFQERILAGILYIVLQACCSSFSVSVEWREENLCIFSDSATLASNILMALSDDNVEENVFNIFALYVKKMIVLNNCELIIKTSSTCGVEIEICKI